MEVSPRTICLVEIKSQNINLNGRTGNRYIVIFIHLFQNSKARTGKTIRINSLYDSFPSFSSQGHEKDNMFQCQVEGLVQGHGYFVLIFYHPRRERDRLLRIWEDLLQKEFIIIKGFVEKVIFEWAEIIFRKSSAKINT